MYGLCVTRGPARWKEVEDRRFDISTERSWARGESAGHRPSSLRFGIDVRIRSRRAATADTEVAGGRSGHRRDLVDFDHTRRGQRYSRQFLCPRVGRGLPIY